VQKKVPKQENTNTSEFPFGAFGALFAKDPATGDELLIFMSVIDTLTDYNFNKKLAHFFKKLKWDSETLSTVRAEFYAERFSGFMLKNILFDEVAIEVPSDEEEDFKDHVAKMDRAGQLPRNARVRSSHDVIKSSNTMTSTTTTTKFSENRARKPTAGTKQPKERSIPEQTEESETNENGNSKKKSDNTKEKEEDEVKKKKVNKNKESSDDKEESNDENGSGKKKKKLTKVKESSDKEESIDDNGSGKKKKKIDKS